MTAVDRQFFNQWVLGIVAVAECQGQPGEEIGM
jgi:hypothetical protein